MPRREPVPERVYDAALRVVTRDPWPDDAGTLAAWWKNQTELSTRDLALEAIRQAAENQIAVVCRS